MHIKHLQVIGKLMFSAMHDVIMSWWKDRVMRCFNKWYYYYDDGRSLMADGKNDFLYLSLLHIRRTGLLLLADFFIWECNGCCISVIMALIFLVQHILYKSLKTWNEDVDILLAFLIILSIFSLSCCLVFPPNHVKQKVIILSMAER